MIWQKKRKQPKEKDCTVSFSFWLALLLVNMRQSMDPHIYEAEEKQELVHRVNDDIVSGNIVPYVRWILLAQKSPAYAEADALLLMLEAVCGKGVVRYAKRAVS